MTPFSFLHSLFIPLIALHLLTAPAQASLKQPFDNTQLPRLAPFLNRTHALSSVSPLSKALSSTVQHSYHHALHNTLSSILATIDKRVLQQHALACNIRAQTWITQSIDASKILQILDPHRECQSSIDVKAAIASSELHPSLIQHPIRILHSAAQQLQQAAQQSLPSVITLNNLTLFNKFYPLSGWTHMEDGQMCRLENAIAYRINSTLYIQKSLTNHPINAFVPDFERAYISEFIDHSYKTLPIVHPRWNDSVLQSASTILQTAQGKADFTSVPMTPSENPALTNAIRHNQVVIDLASDAIVPSNIAVLALPMVMTLIPVAFVAELSTFPTFLYVVFTDLFSVLPFVIKGFELFHSSEVRSKEMIAYYVGSRTDGKIELWVAQCTGEEGFRKVGIAFLIIALCVTTLGMALEIFAWERMKVRSQRPQQQQQHAHQGPFGALLQDTGFLAHREFEQSHYDEFEMRGLGARMRRRRTVQPLSMQRDTVAYEYIVGASDDQSTDLRHDFY
ncbi:hypothetical protein BWQ96_07666 [Gracilariopsis chorda]|uniref:Uncharacterized protein n=1 Tax=Gracilariopsis chorda TaxID=448386 RepID=A0A2V3IKI8_9FLOR|nr:hypothetical protein BWQ96_07666 [Gracilariopsis chorda]|eukprot:PXF42616.1 hypothetical protein BWQ96_07666 [Gracilariopsis chorda]